MEQEIKYTVNNKLYGLDSLRFFAFLSVFICHATPYLEKGNLGIDFFFVLSSFLITFLALKEINATDNFSRKNFFVRRSLRIYPLYFFIVLLSFFALPYLAKLGNADVTLPEKKYLYFLLLSNCDNSDHLFALKFLWSIAVEEQFYILFLLLSLFFKVNIKIPIIALYILFVAGTIVGMKLNWLLYTNPVFYLAHFATGMLAAHYFINGINWKTVHLLLATLFLLAATILFFNIEMIRPFRNIALSLLFASVIINVITLYQRGLLKENKLLIATEHLGKYTYGLYVYSGFVIIFGGMFITVNNIWLKFLLELVIVVIIAWLSYHLFEKRFLQLKKYFRYK